MARDAHRIHRNQPLADRHGGIFDTHNANELTDTTDRAGRRTTYAYNSDGSRTGETWVGASPSERITYTYDFDQEMTGAADSIATLTITRTPPASGPPEMEDFVGVQVTIATQAAPLATLGCDR